VNVKLKIFITIFCYISAAAGLITVVTSVTHKPAQSTSAIIAGVLGVAFLLAGLALTRKPRY
jgi:phosphate/sulfate permease